MYVHAHVNSSRGTAWLFRVSSAGRFDDQVKPTSYGRSQRILCRSDQKKPLGPRPATLFFGTAGRNPGASSARTGISKSREIDPACAGRPRPDIARTAHELGCRSAYNDLNRFGSMPPM